MTTNVRLITNAEEMAKALIAARAGDGEIPGTGPTFDALILETVRQAYEIDADLSDGDPEIDARIWLSLVVANLADACATAMRRAGATEVQGMNQALALRLAELAARRDDPID